MNKKVTIFAYENITAKYYAKQVNDLFDGLIDVESYAVEDGNFESINSDLIIASTHSVYEYVKKHVASNIDMIIADITLLKESVDKLKELPFGTKAMLVNLTIEMAISTIGIIYNYGIDNIEFFPVYPGMAEIPKYDIAVTPGEVDIVPTGVKKIIDLGDRVLSMKTIVDIAVKLNLTHKLHSMKIEKFFDSVIKSDLGLNEFYDQVNFLEKRMDLVLQIFDDGIISLTGNGVINFINDTARKILGVENIKAVGIHVSEISEIFFDIDFGTHLKDKVINIKGQLLILSVFPIRYTKEVSGCMMLLRRMSDVENEQYKIRKQILAKGHVAKYHFDDIIGESETIINLKNVAKKISKSNSAIFIYGESGTGKELFAQSIHNYSDRCEYPFIAVNCAAIPDSLLESELFGYAEGAFTGAKKGGKAGYFELAHKGTLFLDEIGEMDMNLQSRLLRALQEKNIVRIGGDSVIDIDVRIISASNRNLRELVKQNKFRQDLYYRLNVLMLNLPRLHDRSEDIPLLIEALKQEFEVNFEIEQDAMEIIKNCKWEGNVRELRNFVERLVYLDKSIISSDDITLALEYEMLDKSEKMSENIENNRIVDSNNNANSKIMSNMFENTVERFIIKNKNNLYNIYNVLDVLTLTYHSSVKLGRRSLSEKLLNNGIILSEQEIRTILTKLANDSMVNVSKGRGGTVITTLGMELYNLLSKQYHEFM